jgi:DNA-binding transcriptional regulator LsrR (DeoR family)
MYEACVRYYVQSETMESIARHLKLSRSSVSRVLAEAKKSGMVRISLVTPKGSQSPVARKLANVFGIRVHISTVGDSAPITTRFERVSRLAATLLTDSVKDGDLIGAAWGVTLSNVVPYLEPKPLHDATIVQMNGGTNALDTSASHMTSILQALSRNFDAAVVQFPVPAFFDYSETKQAMWRERSVKSVLELHDKLDVSIFGIGSIYGKVPSHVYSAGYLDQAEMMALKEQGVVGDVCTVLLREDGTYEDLEINQRASGLTPAESKRIPIRIGVVADPARASALLGALRAGSITDLVCDDTTARAVIELIDR